jgi:hypothetical protein
VKRVIFTAKAAAPVDDVVTVFTRLTAPDVAKRRYSTTEALGIAAFVRVSFKTVRRVTIAP